MPPAKGETHERLSPALAKTLSGMEQVDDVRVRNLNPLIPASILVEEVPLTPETAAFVCESRRTVEAIVRGNDERVLVIIGPCSVHDTEAALEYARKLKPLQERFADELYIVMRVYFEKPRTTVGWKGLINDPDLDGSCKINKGLRMARTLLHDITAMKIPVAVEYLDTISPQYLADFISWGAIGARTTESQIHRQLASGLSMPIGFKNGTTGNVGICIDAIKASSVSQTFLGSTKQGLAAIVETDGNPFCHVVLRGSSSGPNYSSTHVQETCNLLAKANLPARVMIDCSHGNSQKDHRNQPKVVDDICSQLQSGSDGILGVMIESNLIEGRQDIKLPRAYMQYGQSVTDACISIEQSVDVLSNLAEAQMARKPSQPPSKKAKVAE